ncbi:MAG: methyltransferase domain-containing protein [Candidatus Aenigmatarchaeota archaeon]
MTCKEPLNSLLKYVPSRGLLLDAGCGQLTYTVLVKYFKPELEIIPLDIIIPEHLRNRNKYGFIAASIEELPFMEEVFDFIFCLSTIQLIKDDRGALRELHRVLKKNGILFFTLPTSKSLFRLIRDLEIRCGVYAYPEYNVPHHHYYTTNSILNLIDELFEVVDLYGYHYNFLPRLCKFLISLATKMCKRNFEKTLFTKGVNLQLVFKKKKLMDKSLRLKMLRDLSYHYIVITRKL